MRILELDGLRGIAISLVIGCHYAIFSQLLGPAPQYGWIGVDIFFVLSGFLITSVLLKLKGQDGAYRKFLARRSLRILPPYWLAIAAITCATVILGNRVMLDPAVMIYNFLFLHAFLGYPALHAHIVATTQSGLPDLLGSSMRPNEMGIAGHVIVSIGVFWSLSIEEYFYLFWAPVVLFCRKNLSISVAVFICILEGYCRWAGFLGRPMYLSIYYRFDALVFGALVALLPRIPVAWAIRVFAASATGLASIFFAIRPFWGRDIRDSALFMVFGLPLFCIACAMLISLFVTTTGAVSPLHSFLRSRPLVWLGKISFTLYLFHSFLYLLLREWLNTTWSGLIALPLSLGVAALSWRFLEYPLLSRGTQVPERRSAAVA